jgi:transcription elongation factor Elf1
VSNIQQGPDWWQASDGRWYSPELHPNHQAPLPPPPAVPAPRLKLPSTRGLKVTGYDLLAARSKSANAADARLTCPHCGEVGQVRTIRGKAKRGISGGKATAAVLTAGISVGMTGLSRKQRVTLARCSNCDVTWSM